MELRQLRAIVTVADMGSVTRSAKLLHLAQPAVTRQIRLVEEELGVSLFQRTRSGMIPTAAGVLLVERARRALQELEQVRLEIRPGDGRVTGIVTLGVLESVMDILVPPLVRRVRDRHPGVALRVVTAYSGHLQQWLDSGEVDLSLLYNLAESPSLAVVPLVREVLWVVGPSDAGLQAAHPMPWSDALRHPLILPLPGHGLRALVDRARSTVGIDPTVALETNSLYLQKMFVLAGHGWTVLPAAGVASDVAQGRLSGAPLCEPDISRSVVLGLHRRDRIPASVEAVASEVTAQVHRLVRAGAWPSARLEQERTP